MRYFPFNAESLAPPIRPTWLLVYMTVDADAPAVVGRLQQCYPGVPVVGATSFHGVLTPEGFRRGVHVLAAEAQDGIRLESVLVKASAQDARRLAQMAASELTLRLGLPPDVVLLHATPGFEERLIEGIDATFAGSVPIYGGSAADDDVSGKWSVFRGAERLSEGFLLLALSSRRKVYGEFLGGYLPGRHQGVVTAASGRVVHTLEGRPAAEVYNEWTGGLLQDALGQGGNVLARTTLAPVGRVLREVAGVPVYLLSHPHQVLPGNALSFFSEFTHGDALTLMRGNAQSLVSRAEQVVSRALGSRSPSQPLRGGILIYCGGCVGAVEERMDDVCGTFQQAVGGAPFLGVATFGEQGRARGTSANQHGNLMCDVVLFD